MVPLDRGHGPDRSRRCLYIKEMELMGLKKFLEKHIDFYAHDFLGVSRKIELPILYYMITILGLI